MHVCTSQISCDQSRCAATLPGTHHGLWGWPLRSDHIDLEAAAAAGLTVAECTGARSLPPHGGLQRTGSICGRPASALHAVAHLQSVAGRASRAWPAARRQQRRASQRLACSRTPAERGRPSEARMVRRAQAATSSQPASHMQSHSCSVQQPAQVARGRRAQAATSRAWRRTRPCAASSSSATLSKGTSRRAVSLQLHSCAARAYTVVCAPVRRACPSGVSRTQLPASPLAHW
jgi:hypothetical protein